MAHNKQVAKRCLDAHRSTSGELQQSLTESSRQPETNPDTPEPTSTHLTKPFRLMDLPGEVRNLVYEKIAEDQVATLRSGKLVDKSGLLSVSPQIYEEYLPMLILYAGSIKMEVLNFNFTHIVTFLNKLSDTELAIMPDASKPTTRKVTFILHVIPRSHEEA